MTALHPVLDAFPGLDVLVLGDALLDEYLHGGPTRIAREAPVPVVAVDRREAVPGGAANVAANAAALGARVRFLSVVGDDADGRTLAAALVAAGVGVRDVVVDPGRRTAAKRRVVAESQVLMRFDEGGPAPAGAAARAELARRLPAAFAAADVVVVPDYGYGLLDDDLVATLAGLARTLPRPVVVDSRDVARFRAVRPAAVTPSLAEVEHLLPAAVPGTDRAARVEAGAAALHAASGAGVVAVTLDRDGAVVTTAGRPPHRTTARPAPHSRACGAGDSFTTAFALALGAGAGAAAAADVAQAAAAVVTGRDGTATCSLDDLREHLGRRPGPVEPLPELVAHLAFHRRQGRTVVFTNGCFDLLHRGHVDLLHRARAMGDVLVVGLNDDAGVADRLGPGRPINPLEDRARVLAALSCVDHVVAFDGPTACDLVRVVRPDVYVKGGGHTEESLPEAPVVRALGGTVRIVPSLGGGTTSTLIRRIRQDPAGQGGRRPDGVAAVS